MKAPPIMLRSHESRWRAFGREGSDSIARYQKGCRIEDAAGTCFEAKDAKGVGTCRWNEE
jgi:hypothetical protein